MLYKPFTTPQQTFRKPTCQRPLGQAHGLHAPNRGGDGAMMIQKVNVKTYWYEYKTTRSVLDGILETPVPEQRCIWTLLGTMIVVVMNRDWQRISSTRHLSAALATFGSAPVNPPTPVLAWTLDVQKQSGWYDGLKLLRPNMGTILKRS